MLRPNRRRRQSPARTMRGALTAHCPLPRMQARLPATLHASNPRAPGSRADAPPSRPAHAAPFAARGRRRHAPARDDHAGRDLQRAGDLHDRAPAARTRHRRQRLAVPRPHGDLVLAPVEPARRRREDLGGGQARAIRPSPAPTCSGGTTWRRASRSARRRGRSTRPTGASSPTATPSRRACATSSRAKLGPFPLFQFWGPGTTIASTRWIAEAAKHVIGAHRPTLTLVYLPHLDYDLQRHGPDESHPRSRSRCTISTRSPATSSLPPRRRPERRRPVRIRHHAGRRSGASQPRAARGGPPCGARGGRGRDARSRRIPGLRRLRPPDRACLCRRAEPRGCRCAAAARSRRAWTRCSTGPASARTASTIRARASSSRSPKPNAWFTYYYWLDDGRAPDFARTVEIHRKPGYDPVELFLDPAIRLPEARARRAAREAPPRLAHAHGRDPARCRRSSKARTAASRRAPKTGRS